MKVATMAVFALLAGLPAFQLSADSLTTTFEAGNSNEGMMFNVTADVKLQITAVQIAFNTVPPNTSIVQVYTRRGTYVGNEANPAAWTLNTATSVTSSAPLIPASVIPLPEPVRLLPTETLAFYIRRDDGNTISYTDGDGSGTLEITDGRLNIFEGIGVSGTFGGTFADRIPNVTIYFDVIDAAGPFVRTFGKSRVKTSQPRHQIFGLVTDDQPIEAVRVRYQRLRSNGSKRTVSRLITLDSDGIFRFNAPVFDGRNRVRFTATDVDGVESNTAVVVVTGTP